MENDLREALATISGSIADMRTETRAEITKIRDEVIELKRVVFGSNPPPAGPGTPAMPAPTIEPLPHVAERAKAAEKRASSAEIDVDAVKAQVLVHEANMHKAIADAVAKEVPKAVAVAMAPVKAELTQQSRAMGLGLKGIDWLTSPTGKRAIVSLATAAALGYLTFKTAVAEHYPPPQATIVVPQLEAPAHAAPR